jgi:hypothetical protein
MVTVFAVSPPTTELTPDPELQDGPPVHGVEFALWPVPAAFADEVMRYPVNAPIGASETMAELIVLPVGGSTVIGAKRGQEVGGLCLDGSLAAGCDGDDWQGMGAGDFIFDASGDLTIRNLSESAATLLAVRSLID